MQKTLFAIIKPCLFSPYFGFSDEGTLYYNSHNTFQGLRNTHAPINSATFLTESIDLTSPPPSKPLQQV